MPHANVWIRKKDWAAWQSLENKSEFLHNSLSITEPVHTPVPTRTREEQNEYDESVQGQVENAGFAFVEIDSDGQAHVIDKLGEHYYFDIKFGKVLF
jgi:hypothetical protein